MALEDIRKRFQQAPAFGELQEALREDGTKVALKGLSGSAVSLMVAETFEHCGRPMLFLLGDKEEAAYFLNDLEALIGQKHVLFYPGSYRRPYEIEQTDNANVLLRAEVLSRISSRKKPALIVSYPEALFEKVVTRKELKKNTLKIRKGDTLSLDFLNEVLFEYHFKRVDFVTEPGEFSVRGGIVDVFSFSHDEPYRIEFFGEEVDSIRTFDVESQLSTDPKSRVHIIPNVADKVLHEARESFLKYISPETVLFIKDQGLARGKLDQLFAKAETAFASLGEGLSRSQPGELFLNAGQFSEELEGFRCVTLGEDSPGNGHKIRQIELPTRPQPAFNKQFDMLRDSLRESSENGMQNYLFCSSEQQVRRFADIFRRSGRTYPIPRWSSLYIRGSVPKPLACVATQTTRSLNATTVSICATATPKSRRLP